MTILDINAEARSLVDADTTSYPAASLLRRVNNAYEQVIGWLINADGTAQFDDTNYTDFPIGTYTLVDGQGKYSFNDKFLQIINVKVLNSNDIWSIIKPIDQSEKSSPFEEAYKTDGMPIRYDKFGDDTIQLLPAPDDGTQVTLASGLKIYFKRTAKIFTSGEVTTGTKVPGFASTNHVILSYMAAIPYAAQYKRDRLPWLMSEVARMKKEVIDHYSRFEKDKRKVITFETELFR